MKEYKYYDKRRLDVRDLAIVFEITSVEEKDGIKSDPEELAVKVNHQIRDNESKLVGRGNKGSFEVFVEFCEFLNDKHPLL